MLRRRPVASILQYPQLSDGTFRCAGIGRFSRPRATAAVDSYGHDVGDTVINDGGGSGPTVALAVQHAPRSSLYAYRHRPVVQVPGACCHHLGDSRYRS